MLTYGFPPIAAPDARALVLGTLPSRLSVERGEYYANPQNAFWRILGADATALPLAAKYSERIATLIERKVALWDVLAAATRAGSLDADIGEDAVANNFGAFFRIHPHIEHIYFNGSEAEALYRKLVEPTLVPPQSAIARTVLPSTSSANARITFAQKVARWAAVWAHGRS